MQLFERTRKYRLSVTFHSKIWVLRCLKCIHYALWLTHYLCVSLNVGECIVCECVGGGKGVRVCVVGWLQTIIFACISYKSGGIICCSAQKRIFAQYLYDNIELFSVLENKTKIFFGNQQIYKLSMVCEAFLYQSSGGTFEGSFKV